MKTRQLALGLSALALAATGCSTGKDSGTPAPAGAASSVAAGQQAAGMSKAPGQPAATGHSHTMAAGETMAGHSHPAKSAQPTAGSEPSAAAKMVCSGRVPDTVRTVLKLSAPAPTSTSWQDQLYTCTYTLPMGKMVLSVKESASKPAARDYFQALRAKLGDTGPLLGVGEQAYATKTGTAVVLKDNMTLRVDTTALPPVFGPQQQRRTDLAYQMATIVMGCWVDHQ
ncbi:MAG TPA: hypothetical protein VF557_15050 [Jatrophihabitans sp.]|jgi:hypothetical protein|uniref:hypothetical protein n=1 Tax=Jatrophihabitans sp. TaxID=1932789 RepID=UPI002EEAD378